jgi:hypothetical protein
MAYLLPLSYKLFLWKIETVSFINYMINSKVIILIYKIIAALVIVASVVVREKNHSINIFCTRMKIQLLQRQWTSIDCLYYVLWRKIFCIAMYLYSVLFYYNFTCLFIRIFSKRIKKINDFIRKINFFYSIMNRQKI